MRRHDGLQHVLEQLIAADAALPSSHGTPYRLTVLVPHTTLTAHLGAHRGPAGVDPGQLPDGWPLSPLTVQTMACGADLVPVLIDEAANPLDIGDTIYSFPTKIRAAITARDRGCTYHGCDTPPSWCHAHHLIPASQDGPTSVTNGALLCGRHHRYVHALNLRGKIINGVITWRPPTRPGEPRDGPLDDNPTTNRAAIDRALTALTQRWLNRNPHLRR